VKNAANEETYSNIYDILLLISVAVKQQVCMFIER